MKVPKIIVFILCVLSTLIVGAISGISTSDGITNWYVTLNKPTFNPPNYIFGPVWTVLYILMGISLFQIIQTPISITRKKSLLLFFLQLLLNFLWSFLFFKYHLLILSFIEIIILWLCILIMIKYFLKINKTSAYLQVPYLLWVTFAAILNGSFLLLN